MEIAESELEARLKSDALKQANQQLAKLEAERKRKEAQIYRELLMEEDLHWKEQRARSLRYETRMTRAMH